MAAAPWTPWQLCSGGGISLPDFDSDEDED